MLIFYLPLTFCLAPFRRCGLTFQLRRQSSCRWSSWACAARTQALEVVRAALASAETGLLGNHTAGE